MKLYVINRENNQKIYLKTFAPSRKELRNVLGSMKFKADDRVYYVSQVKAEKSTDNSSAGMVLGGAVGLLGGAPGVIIGGILGTLFGKEQDEKEDRLVDNFNRSVDA